MLIYVLATRENKDSPWIEKARVKTYSRTDAIVFFGGWERLNKNYKNGNWRVSAFTSINTVFDGSNIILTCQ